MENKIEYEDKPFVFEFSLQNDAIETDPAEVEQMRQTVLDALAEGGDHCTSQLGNALVSGHRSDDRLVIYVCRKYTEYTYTIKP